MCNSHGGGGLVASLHTSMLAEGDVGAPVNRRLVGIVVVWQQGLLELALVPEDCLKTAKQRDVNILTCGPLDEHHTTWVLLT